MEDTGGWKMFCIWVKTQNVPFAPRALGRPARHTAALGRAVHGGRIRAPRSGTSAVRSRSRQRPSDHPPLRLWGESGTTCSKRSQGVKTS